MKENQDLPEQLLCGDTYPFLEELRTFPNTFALFGDVRDGLEVVNGEHVWHTIRGQINEELNERTR